MTGIEKLRNLSATLGEGQPFTLEGIYIGGKTASEWLADVSDQIERETLPRPRFEDGEPVQFGDEYDHCGKAVKVEEIGYTWFKGDVAWHVKTICGPVWFRMDGPLKRPEPPKVLDADGIEIKVGDEVWDVRDDERPWIVEKVDGKRVICSFDEPEWHRRRSSDCSMLTHRRPEPPDTWERIETDIVNKINPCVYFGWSDKECGEGGGCPGHGPKTNCSKARARDLVRRCKKLAGVE